MTIDWPHRRIYLDPLTTDPGHAEAPPSASLGWNGGHFIIAALADGTALTDAGVALGDVVAAVDGVDITDASLADYCPYFLDDTTAEHEIMLADGRSFTAGPVEGFFDDIDG